MKYLPFIFLLSTTIAFAAESDDLLDYMDRHAASYDELALDIWDFAELGYLETRSTQRLQQTLSKAGFEIQSGVAGIPTAFVASFGEGEPVIGCPLT